MYTLWLFFAIGGFLALALGRAAVIAIWPDSAFARFCEFRLGFLDRDETGGDWYDVGDSGGDGGGD